MSIKKLKQRQRRLRKTHGKNWCFVYTLKDDNGEIRYVGQTRCMPEIRLKNHVKSVKKLIASQNRLSPVQKWIRELVENEKQPIIEIIDRNGIWDISEAVWIDRLRRDGKKLLNVASVVLEAKV